MTVSTAALTRKAVERELKSYPELYHQRCLLRENREGGWSYPARYGFSEIDVHQADRAFQAELVKLKQEDVEDVLWQMFLRGARWAEGWRGETWKDKVP